MTSIISDKHAADRNMIKAIDRFGGRKTNTEKIVKKIMQAKDVVVINKVCVITFRK